MNAITSFLTSTPAQGDTSVQNNGSVQNSGPQGLGFAALLESTDSRREQFVPQVQAEDSTSDDRSPRADDKPDTAKQDQNSRLDDNDNRSASAESDSKDTGESKSSFDDRGAEPNPDNNDQPANQETTETSVNSQSGKGETTQGDESNAATASSDTPSTKSAHVTTSTVEQTVTHIEPGSTTVSVETPGATIHVANAGVTGGAAQVDVQKTGTANVQGQVSAPSPSALPSEAGTNSGAAAKASGGNSASATTNSQATPNGQAVGLNASQAPSNAATQTLPAAGNTGPADPAPLLTAQTSTQNAPVLAAGISSAVTQAAKIVTDDLPQIKVTVENQDGAPKPLLNLNSLAATNTQTGGQNANSGSGNGGASGGNTGSSAADLLLSAQVANENKFSGAVAQASAAKSSAGSPAPAITPTATGPTAGLLASGGPALASGTVQSTGQIATPQAPTAGTSVAEQVSVHIARAAQSGITRFNIQLQPADLGRVEVRLEVAQDGKIQAVVTADRQDTLELLQRDARGLDRALQNAGLKTDSNSLSFSLRNQEDGDGTFAQAGNSQPESLIETSDDSALPLDIPDFAAQAGDLGNSDLRLNILV